jgi:hypothetical protein
MLHSIPFFFHIAHISQSILCTKYECVSKTFRTELIMKYTPTFRITRCCPLQRVMAAKLTRLTHKIAIQLRLLAGSCTICSSRSRRPVRKLLDTLSYTSWYVLIPYKGILLSVRSAFIEISAIRKSNMRIELQYQTAMFSLQTSQSAFVSHSASGPSAP